MQSLEIFYDEKQPNKTDLTKTNKTEPNQQNRTELKPKQYQTITNNTEPIPTKTEPEPTNPNQY